ncbi:hypothetical protein KIN20_036835 [Parelaphostrongylus tenuis]|uniref:Reverse transcriptase domain-containing protein n=1 Tax=Parelaphostrongylus tenuis TaxID=148309 RepID=A0AAD5RDK6_PARTN|nr:hypothetical protein KIN20_036835 [Parelaphostrongylus tenuis]
MVGNYFAQIRGLAMGQRLAPTLAIAFMSKVKSPIIDLRSLLYSLLDFVRQLLIHVSSARSPHHSRVDGLKAAVVWNSV